LAHAACSRKLHPQPAKLVRGKLAPPNEPKRNAGEKRQEAQQRRGGRALRLPAEPADDASLSVQHRLKLVSAARLGFKLQLFESRGALEDVDELGLGVGEIGGDRGQGLDCSRKCCSVLGQLCLDRSDLERQKNAMVVSYRVACVTPVKQSRSRRWINASLNCLHLLFG